MQTQLFGSLDRRPAITVLAFLCALTACTVNPTSESSNDNLSVEGIDNSEAAGDGENDMVNDGNGGSSSDDQEASNTDSEMSSNDGSGTDSDATDDPDVTDSEDPATVDEPVSRLAYVNLTDDTDQNEDSSFDTRNSYASMSESGQAIAYLSNIDTTGEDGETPNAEVYVMINGQRIQITQTTDITNSADNSYEASNWGPAISDDGAIVVFGSDGNITGGGSDAIEQIYLYDVSNGQVEQLSHLDTPSGGIQKDWVGFPRVGGNAIAWIENDTDCPTFGCSQETRLRVVDRAGHDLMVVVFDSTLAFDDFALASDGESIVFVSSADPAGMNPGGYTQLFHMGVGGGSIHQVSMINSSASGWTPKYRRPALSPNGEMIAVWSNDPAYTDTEDQVLVLVDLSGNLVRILARAGVDFPSGDDDTFRAHFAANGEYLAFATSWSFGYTQRNFRAAVDGSDLMDLGVGYKSGGPYLTNDGGSSVICGAGDGFFPDQTFQNVDWNDEVWIVTVSP